jgi:hypothetical protein
MRCATGTTGSARSWTPREDVLTYMDYPKEHWNQLASTTPWNG